MEHGQEEDVYTSALLTRKWIKGDRVGCLFDPASRMIMFTLNGNIAGDSMYAFMESRGGSGMDTGRWYHAAVSCSGGRAVLDFNIGNKKFATENT